MEHGIILFFDEEWAVTEVLQSGVPQDHNDLQHQFKMQDVSRKELLHRVCGKVSELSPEPDLLSTWEQQF